MTFIGGSESINSFTMWQKKGPGGHEYMSWGKKSNFILTKSVSPSHTPSSQPLQRNWCKKKKTAVHCMVLSPAPYFSILCKMADNQVSAHQCRRKIHIKMYFAWPYICSRKHTWGREGGSKRCVACFVSNPGDTLSSGARLFIEAVSSCLLLRRPAAVTPARRHRQSGISGAAGVPGRTPSTPPEILIMCREGAVQKKLQLLEPIYHEHLCFNPWRLDSSLLAPHLWSTHTALL